MADGTHTHSINTFEYERLSNISGDAKVQLSRGGKIHLLPRIQKGWAIRTRCGYWVAGRL